MSWIMWAVWIVRIAFNLIGKMSKFRKEVPEAIESIKSAREEITKDLSGGLTAEEVVAIRAKLIDAWEEIDDVLRLFSDVIPVPVDRTIKI